MNDLVILERDGDVGLIALNNPPVNALSPGVIDGLKAGFANYLKDRTIRAIVLLGMDRAFCGGADIKEFGKLAAGGAHAGDILNPLFNSIEEANKPVVAAIHGSCLGGGLEMAMACHYRVAAHSAVVGQPEVKIGLIPGAGGTQRLPRLVGLAKAAEMCAVGNPVPAAEAHALGILDEVFTGQVRNEAIKYARSAADRPPRRTRDLNEKLKDASALPVVKDQVRKRSAHLIAPMKAIEAVEAAVALPFAKGLKAEAKLFEECLKSDQSKALIHLFFSEREVSKIFGLPKDPPAPIQQAAVVGAGTMGCGIAMTYANAGIPVWVLEVDQAGLDRGIETMKRNFAATVQKGKLTQADMDKRVALIRPTLNFADFADADIVVEAVFESLEIKKDVFRALDRFTKPDAILATNTSTLDIDAIAAATNRPQQVIGHHFFSPANVMKLLEIVRGSKTSCPVIAASMALAKTLGKTGVLVGNCWGFVGNRMFFPYLREAQLLVEDGAVVEAVDAVFAKFGMAMGPFAVDDLAGIDVGWRVRQENPGLIPAGCRAPKVADRLYELGRYGQKTGAGWYRYEPNGRAGVSDHAVQQLIEETAKQSGIVRRSVAEEEMLERPLYALINESAKVLEEGIALRASDIDIIYVYGYGFPPHRGGPMWYADTVGLAKVYERVRDYEREHGAIWKPSTLLKQLAESGRTFADFDRERTGMDTGRSKDCIGVALKPGWLDGVKQLAGRH